MTPGLRSFGVLLGTVVIVLLVLWLYSLIAARRARRLAEEEKTLRLRQRLQRQAEYRKLANPIDWKPAVDGLDTAHLEVRHEPEFVVKEEP